MLQRANVTLHPFAQTGTTHPFIVSEKMSHKVIIHIMLGLNYSDNLL